ncbi:MAG: hypothetical protein JF593_09615 [Novosphingobium sp.]|nr:hypothetical protein [Novosphingobium sp.]
MDDPDRDPTLAPETINNEQEDEETQAQTIADEALLRRGTNLGLGDTEKVTTGDDSDDAQDLVDHMRQMERSGKIDLSAFRGERSDDDEEGVFGEDTDEY